MAQLACWERIMFLKAYVDDSGSDPSQSVFVLGGVVMPNGWWSGYREDWRSVLYSNPRIPYFKASEVWARKPGSKSPFLNFTDDQRRGKVDGLVDALCEYQPTLISCRMEWDVFRRFKSKYRLRKGNSSPYFWLYYGMISRCAYKINHEEANPTPVSFVFDNQNIIGHEAKNYYRFFKRRCSPALRKVLGKEPTFSDDRRTTPLQAADLYAWYRRKEFLGLGSSGWQKSVWARLKPFHSSVVIEEPNLVKMGSDLGVI